MFENLPYDSKIKVCELYYKQNYNFSNLPELDNPNIYFSWKNIWFENKVVNVSCSRKDIEKWYSENMNIIRKHKLLSIKRKMVA